jgi:cardiolipin synthase (CMP-forming)
LNLPNIITLGRLLSVPLAIWLILSGEYWAAFWTFVFAGVSDAVDGFIAKRFNMRTQIGALLDPVADKALLVSVYVTLGVSGQLPTWLVILVVFRDLMIVGGFVLVQLLVQKIRWEPLIISKINTALQIVLAAFTLARLGFGAGDHGAVMLLVLAVATTTVLSGAAYLVRWARAIAGQEAGV